MIQEIDRWDAEKWLQDNKDIWNHPMVSDRTDKNGYEVADLLADFANCILSKQKQKTIDTKKTAVEWLVEQLNAYSHSIGMPLGTNLRIDIPKETIEKAKEMEKEQKNNMPIHIHEGISNTWVYIEDGVVHVKPNDDTYGGNKMKKFTDIVSKDKVSGFEKTAREMQKNQKELDEKFEEFMAMIFCQFEPDSNLTSATKCKWCGRDKWKQTYGGNK
jgi:hypothetical protein